MELQDPRASAVPEAVGGPAILALTVAVCFVLMLAEGYDVQASVSPHRSSCPPCTSH